MPDTSWCWEHFIKGDQKYKRDKTHFESWCKGCIASRMEVLKESDQREVLSGLLDTIRSVGELRAQGMSRGHDKFRAEVQ